MKDMNHLIKDAVCIERLKVLGKILWAYHTWPLVTSEIQEETKRI